MDEGKQEDERRGASEDDERGTAVTERGSVQDRSRICADRRRREARRWRDAADTRWDTDTVPTEGR